MKKRSSQITNTLDDIKSEDPKKRIQSTLMLKEVANAIGPARTRSQLMPFLLNECIDDQEEIINSLIDQLKDFIPLIGGQEHQKCVVPLLIAFCKIDERAPAEKSVVQLVDILSRNHDIITDTIKKISKAEMVIAKDCTAKLISSQINNVSLTQSPALIEIYFSIVTNQNPTIRKTGAKHIKDLLSNANPKFKDEIGKMFENIYNDIDDLPKLLALDGLVNYYQLNSNLVLSKIKNLMAIQSWRVSLKICELMNIISTKFSKSHFKTIIQPAVFKLLSSPEPQVKAAACKAIEPLARHLSQQQIKSKLIPLLKVLTQDQSQYVKIALAQNILKLCNYASKQTTKEIIIPIAIDFTKSPDFQLAIGIMTNFDILSTHISDQVFEQNILKKVTYNFNSENWRLKCESIQLIGKVLQNPSFLNEKTISTIMELANDKVDAVRKKVVELICQIIKKQSKDWSDANIIPHIGKLKDCKNYLFRQNAITIVEKTCNKVSERTLNNVYRPLVAALLNDRVPNVRALALGIIKENPSIIDKTINDALSNLRDEKDIEVRNQLKAIKV